MNGTHITQRRASPPRPSLMVGDMAACRAAFGRLQAACTALSSRQASSAQDWAALVPRFRALRESLLSLGADGSTVSAALEASADACARAGDWAEFLKAAQQLVLSVYPALAAQEQVAEDLQRLRISRSTSTENGGALAEPAQPQRTAPENDGAAWGSSQPRWPEYTGAFLLYFVCVPPTPQSMDIACVLRRLPHSLQRCPQSRFALAAHQAVRGGDATAFLALHARGTWLQRALMGPKLQQMREQAVAVLASAFRSLSCAAAARLLRLEEPPEAARQVLALLQASAAHGCAGAGRALSSLQVAERAPDANAVLMFRS